VTAMTDTMLPTTTPPAVLLHVVREAVGDLTSTLWAARTPQELVATMQACEALRSTLDAVQLQVVVEIDATNAAAVDGWASTKDFLTAVTGGVKGAGRRLLALARAVSGDRAATGAALAGGGVSRVQAEVVVAAVDRLPVDTLLREAAERLLLEHARDHDATDLSHVARRVVERLDPDGSQRRDERALAAEERAAHLGRFLSLREDGIGGVRLTGRGTVEDAAHLRAVLLPLAAPRPTAAPGACGGTPLGATGTPGVGPARGREGAASTGPRTGSCGVADCAHDGRDPRDHGTRMWDALIEAGRLLATTEVLPTSHAARPRVSVLIDLDALRSGLGTGTIETGGTLSAAAVRTLACDADVLPFVLGSRSQVLDVGRTSRLVTLGLWLALTVRDRHCAFPGCSRLPVACDAHHIVHWADGGGTSLDNLVLLCRSHHTMIHTTPWEVRLNPEDHAPEFLPPPRLDPDRRPRRRQPLRT